MFAVERLTPAIGGFVSGLSRSMIYQSDFGLRLHTALMEHQVLMFDVDGLEPLDLVAIGETLGTLGARHHRYRTHDDSDDVVVLEWQGTDQPDAAEWHSDMTYRNSPPFASILRAVVVPPSGGDTLWSSMYAVHDALPAGLRDELRHLEAVHDMGAFRTPAYREGGSDGLVAAMGDAGMAVHPVISTHPFTGRQYLNVSESFTRWIVGMSAPESARLLTMLFDLINRPEHHVRLRWKPGRCAIWDNRGTQHYACADYLPERRVMHRVAVATDYRSPTAGKTT